MSDVTGNGRDPVYPIADDEAFVLPQPSGVVSLNTITYVQDLGMAFRIVAVPGSDSEMFNEETEDQNLCDCTSPAVWQFVAVSRTGRVVNYSTIDGHEASYLMSCPDRLFADDPDLTVENGYSELRMVPPGSALTEVNAEMLDWVRDLGVDIEQYGASAIRYDDVINTDIAEAFEKFLSEGRDD